MNIVFLDYDGVINTPMWSKRTGEWTCYYNYPEDNRVNNIQAVQWVSDFCEKYDYSIVVSSTWRFDCNYKECLVNAGLRDGVKIIGKTPYVKLGTRGDEIGQWLGEHPDVTNFLIFDDESDVGKYADHLVLCRSSAGFRQEEFYSAERIHKWMINGGACDKDFWTHWSR